MIIDSHTHLGRNEHIKATAEELICSMDKAGIEKSLVFAGDLNDAPNEWMIEQIKPFKDRLHGVMSYNPNTFHYANFKRMAEKSNIVGIKFYVGYEHYYPADLYAEDKYNNAMSIYYNPLQICSELGIPAIFHCGDCLNSVKKAKLKFAHPLNIDEPAVDYDDVTFVIAHMGYPWVRDAAEVCYKNDNVYSDVSGFVYGEFLGDDYRKFSNSVNSFLDIAGNNKLLFGSDWPIARQDSYVKNVRMLSEQSLCPAPEYMSQITKKIFKL